MQSSDCTKYIAISTTFVFNFRSKPAKIWPDAKGWEQFDAAKMPVTLFSINDKTGDYVVDGVMLKRHAFWASLFDSELKAEEENPPKEDF